MDRRRRQLPDLLAGFWFLTSLVSFSGPVLAVIVLLIDKSHGNAGAFPGLVVSPDSARTILGSISGSLITIASLTSSLTIVTLQLLSNQYTPRTVRGFLARRRSQVVLGSFIAIFLYCLVLLVAVREPGDENAPFVPSLGIVVSVVLAVVGLVILVLFIHSMSQTIQVSTMARQVADDTAGAIEAVHGPPNGEVSDPGLTGVGVPAGRTGFIRGIDPGVIAAAAGSAQVHVVVRPGEFVTPATRIAVIAPDDAAGPALTDAVRRAVYVARERDIRDDPGYGIRQLADIALRALSPGINDPSTAITCLGYLRALLEDLAQRELPACRAFGPSITLCEVEFADYLGTVVEIATYAGSDARVVWALLDALASIGEVAHSDERRDYVRRVREEVRVAAVGDARLAGERTQLERDLR